MSNHPQKSGSLCSGMSGSLYSGIGGSLYPGILTFFDDIGLFEYSGHKINQANRMKLTNQTEPNWFFVTFW